MAAIDDLVVATRELLEGTGRIERPAEDTLAADITTTGQTTVTFSTANLWRRDDYAEIGEELMVCAADHSGNVTVRRAQRGTTAATYSTGDVIRHNPQAPVITLKSFINEVANNDLWPQVWSPEVATITWVDNQYTYDLPAKYGDVANVYQAYDDKFKPFHTGWWEVERTVHTDVASTGQALRIGHVHDSAQTIYYTGKIKPSSSNLDNLDQKVLDLIPWKAAAKFMLSRVGAERAGGGRARGGTGSPHGDYAALEVEFRSAKETLRRQLLRDYPQAPKFRPTWPRWF